MGTSAHCLRVGWAGLQNGALLQRAEGQFDAFITLDSSLPHQQNLSGLHIGVVLVRAKSNDINDILPLMPDILKALATLEPGGVARAGL